MPSLNPFAPKIISYRDLSKESSEQDRDNGGEPSSADTEHHDAENDYLLASRFYRPRNSRCMHACGYIVVALVSLTVGLVFSQLYRLEREIKGYPKPYASPRYNVHDVVWQQNASYSGEPTEENDKTWADLIPDGRGFVRHPVLAKELKAVSVFHQIHCLHGIRTEHYKNTYLVAKLQHKQSIRRPSRSPNDHPHILAFTPNAYIESLIETGTKHQHGPAHIPHCIDYLRQAILCAADSNLEDTYIQGKSDSGGDLIGSDGWDSKRVCRDYRMIKEWSETWSADPTKGGID
ncbi:hypothetical protein DDE82_000133 [Stemphylium lycopersici]|uniref:Tat pathway signal sequence n=1 Tax=Stemphylium lycopersici TaxID=183478 RepID=A0A364N946_STELY|nr:hypothetical protein DDE82_000133 [Stemphylium lycopersici]RAR13786.1 hypothetical protein DDE83_002823 [Stemphylium lycopersici]